MRVGLNMRLAITFALPVELRGRCRLFYVQSVVCS
jgi:hypothetical protein